MNVEQVKKRLDPVLDEISETGTSLFIFACDKEGSVWKAASMSNKCEAYLIHSVIAQIAGGEE